MQFDVTTTYPAPLGEALDALKSAELADKRGALLRAKLNHSVDGQTVTTTGQINPDELPQMARRFISKPQGVTVTQVWTQSDGTATGPITIDAGSLPVKVSATQTLTENGSETSSRITGEVKVTIPLIGGKIEKLVADKLNAVLAKDTKLVTEVLS